MGRRTSKILSKRIFMEMMMMTTMNVDRKWENVRKMFFLCMFGDKISFYSSFLRLIQIDKMGYLKIHQ